MLPDYPVPTTNLADGRKPVPGLSSGPSCYDALSHPPDANGFEELLASDAVSSAQYGYPTAYAAEIRCLRNDSWFLGEIREWNPDLLTSSARTEHTSISRRRFHETDQGKVEPISRFYRLSKDGVSNTLRAGTDGARGAFTSPRPIHYQYDRCITVREMARLHGFPDWFRFHATKWHGARQIGNAVPPPLARHIATKVREALGAVAVRPDNIVALGDPKLLWFDLTQAAEYFGVEAPPSRRDRKSGARKRRQVDIERERLMAL